MDQPDMALEAPAGMPFAVWNPGAGFWESPQLDLCGLPGVFSGIWPASGLMRNGLAYRRPRWERLIAGSGCSSWPGALLRTPLASDSIRGRETLARVKARKGTIALTHQVMDLIGPEPPPEDAGTVFGLIGTLFDGGDPTPRRSPDGNGSPAGRLPAPPS
ncbi:MAG: hypothetical protein LBG11_04855 [Bifidobacteriaceae bacterium]|jgi:hypothetical protein|nr:hypothetical protein [Bifidobacteriaceae bacterium]